MPEVRLRPLVDADEEPLFLMMRDPVAVRMAAFTAADPDDREAFSRHFRRIRSSPENRTLAIEADGRLAGMVAAFPMEGEREVTYWVDRAQWGRGIASAALALLLEAEPVRPLAARAAAANTASLRVLRSAGFVEVGRETSYAAGVDAEVEEVLLVLG